MIKRPLPPGFIVPAQPVERDRPPASADWVHEIKHDGYRLLVRREGERVRLWTRNAVDLTDRLPLITSAAVHIEAQSFTIDGEAVVLGPDGLSQFNELRSASGTRRAILYAFDLLELDGTDMRERPFLERKTALANLMPGVEDGILLNEHIAADGSARVRSGLQAWRRGHRFEAGGCAVQIGSVRRMDKGPQSGIDRRPAGAK